MAGGLMIFGLMIVVLGFGFFMTFVRAPRCARCHIPLQPVAEPHVRWERMWWRRSFITNARLLSSHGAQVPAYPCQLTTTSRRYTTHSRRRRKKMRGYLVKRILATIPVMMVVAIAWPDTTPKGVTGSSASDAA